MATNIIEKEGKYYLTQLWGGEDKGICLQITAWAGVYFQLTYDEVKELIQELQMWLDSFDKKPGVPDILRLSFKDREFLVQCHKCGEEFDIFTEIISSNIHTVFCPYCGALNVLDWGTVYSVEKFDE